MTTKIEERLDAVESLLQSFCDAIEVTPEKKPSFRDSLPYWERRRLDKAVLAWIEYCKQPIRFTDEAASD
jgi:hypothetical protein